MVPLISPTATTFSVKVRIKAFPYVLASASNGSTMGGRAGAAFPNERYQAGMFSRFRPEKSIDAWMIYPTKFIRQEILKIRAEISIKITHDKI
ncbi:hypothetical protein ACETRX_36035 [Labrys portucalensis]|uniref:Uncharacterized protein n=1 Tax=Labrys neptuniae TaxID=376174 RepID=A0ABV6ZS71_9HYPH